MDGMDGAGLLAALAQGALEAVQALRQAATGGPALVQAACLGGALLTAWVAAGPLRRAVARGFPGGLDGDGLRPRLGRALSRTVPALFLALILAVLREALAVRGLPYPIIRFALTLVLAAAAILLASALIRSPFMRKLFSALALALAALHVLGVLGPVARLLDGVGFDLGGARVTLLSLGKAAVVLAVLVRVGNWAVALGERRLDAVDELSPSARVLAGKVAKIGVYALAVLAAVGSVGIDLTALTVFSGAVGVGVGFGLRNIFANLISGLILLVDKSIKPGDVIEIGGVYGWITQLRARFVSVVTRDGKEYLIPNEDLITSQVVNWSYTDRKVRLKVPVGVAYGTDVRRALALMTRAASGVPRVLAEPGPVACMLGFGDSSLDLELRVWIEDPQNGVTNVLSDLRLAVLDAFRDAGVAIPFPQRDVHIIPHG